MGQITTWVGNVFQAARLLGLGVVGIGVVVLGIRYVVSSWFGNERQNILAREGIIPLVIGSVLVLGATAALAILHAIAGA